MKLKITKPSIITMHSITLTGGLADVLGQITMTKFALELASEIHEPLLLRVKGGKHHNGWEFRADPPQAKPVRLVKLGTEQWMVQGRHGKNHDGQPFNAVGGSVTFPTQDAAKLWLQSEPAGRWIIVL